MEKKKLNVLMGVLAAGIVVVATVLGVRFIGQSSDSGTEGNGGVGKDTTVSGDSTYIEPVTEIEIPDDGMYSIEVKTEGDMFFEGIGIYIYTDNTMEELVWFDKTDENGIADFTAEDATGYVAVLQDIPEGYNIQEYYYITGAKTEIILGTALKESVDLSAIEYSLGDVIHDFTVTAPDGTTYTVSEILEKKKAIILNFWYVQCGPCKEEFPHMNEAYAEYKDKIEILAMNPVNLDDEEIAKYIKDMGIKFPMMQCEEDWATAMGITAYPTTVVIDRYGVISLIHRGSLPDTEIFKQLFEFYSADDYKQTVVEDIYDIVSAQLSEGTMDNPFEMGGILDFEITIKPEQVIYFNMYRVDQMNVRIADEDAYAIYEERTYYPENGVVGFKVSCPDTYTPAFVGIGNAGTEKKTFHVTLGADLGTYENPYTLNLGEFSASVDAGNDQGVFYEYRASKTGALTIQCLSATKGIKYDYYLQNMRTSENRNLEYDGVEDEKGKKSVSINVEKGDRVLICISTIPDSSGTYPAGNFRMKASLGNSIATDEQYYGVSVVDDKLKPVGGISVKLTCEEIEPIEGVDDSKDEDTVKVGDEFSLTTDAKGVASRKTRIGKYTATIKVPDGYTADTTEYIITKDDPNITFMLNKTVTEMVKYKVSVVDSNEKPIKNVSVKMGGILKSTTKGEKFTFELPKGDYEVFVSADGYTSKKEWMREGMIKDGVAETTIVLEKANEDDLLEKAEYTVTIKYQGTVPKGLSENIKIHFMYDGMPEGAATTVVLSEGTPQVTSKIQMPKKDYTIELEFADGSKLRTYTTDMTITSKKPLVVEVGEAIDVNSGKENVDYESVYVKGNINDSRNAYYVTLGTNPVVGIKNVDDYVFFMFTPEEKGVYSFSTANANEKLSYWVGNPMAGVSLDESMDYSNNKFTLTIEHVGPSYIIGIKGAKSATLNIEKTGNVAEAIKETVYYEGKPAPKNLSVTGGSKLFDTNAATGTYSLVYNSADGYYHLGKADGPVIYVNLNHPSLSLTTLIANTGFKCYVYENEDNPDLKKLVKIWDFTQRLTQYVNAAGKGYYPLTEDLRFIIENGGAHQGWWDSSSVLFNGNPVNSEIAWLFFCCYQ